MDIDFYFKREHFNYIYIPLLHKIDRYLVLVGGRGSGKSVFCAQRLIAWLLNNKTERILLTRKVGKTIKQSQFQLIRRLVGNYKLNKYFEFFGSTNRIVCASGSETLAVGLDDSEKIKSLDGITKVWIEEATEISEKDFTDIDLLLRGKAETVFQILASFNPMNEHHWLNSFFFLREVEDAYCLRTTYQDNRFIDPHYRKVLESIRDKNLRKIYLEGLWGTLQNIIYEPYEILNKFPAEFDETIYGLDFGFNNPSALIEVGIRDQEYYLREKIYKTKLTNADLIKEMERVKIPKNKEIYADSAEPARVEEIRRAGYNIYLANKNVKDGIDFCKSQKIFTLPENDNLNKERQSYKYKEDKDGNVLKKDEPEKFMDHLMDAKRYAMYSHSQKRKPQMIIV